MVIIVTATVSPYDALFIVKRGRKWKTSKLWDMNDFSWYPFVAYPHIWCVAFFVGNNEWLTYIFSPKWPNGWFTYILIYSNLGAVRQQAITWANVDSVPCRLMASLGHNKLTNAPYDCYWWQWYLDRLFSITRITSHVNIYIAVFPNKFGFVDVWLRTTTATTLIPEKPTTSLYVH